MPIINPVQIIDTITSGADLLQTNPIVSIGNKNGEINNFVALLIIF
jgi:hypothetical protein